MDSALQKLRDDVASVRVGDNARLIVLRSRFESLIDGSLKREGERFIKHAREIEFVPRLAFDANVSEAKWITAREEMVALVDSVLEYVEIAREGRNSTASPLAPEVDRKKVFVVHGHNIDMLNAVRAHVAHLGLDPIVLAEEPNAGMTIFEKFEQHANVGFAVVLLSPDDVGKSRDSRISSEMYRARQNVVLELGYFMCRPGRKNTVALVDVSDGDDLEKPSDIAGILYVEYNKMNEAWKRRLYGELKNAGADIRPDRY